MRQSRNSGADRPVPVVSWCPRKRNIAYHLNARCLRPDRRLQRAMRQYPETEASLRHRRDPASRHLCFPSTAQSGSYSEAAGWSSFSPIKKQIIYVSRSEKRRDTQVQSHDPQCRRASSRATEQSFGSSSPAGTAQAQSRQASGALVSSPFEAFFPENPHPDRPNASAHRPFNLVPRVSRPDAITRC